MGYYIVTKGKETKMKKTARTMMIMIFTVVALMMALVQVSAADSIDEKASEVLAGIESHEENIKVSFTANSKDGNKIAKDMWNKAVEMSDMTDYVKYGVYDSYNVSWSARGANGEYTFEITYKVNYKMTKSQSKAFEKKLAKTVAKMKLNGKSDKAKVKKIYNWITKNVKYDRRNNNIKYTAYAALNKKKAVCQGYSVLFYRMCEEAGVDAKVVTGTSRNENHAWNIAKVGNKYYNLDSTWDAGKSTKNYKYFMKGMKNFKGHKRSSEYNSNTFYNAYPMANK